MATLPSGEAALVLIGWALPAELTTFRGPGWYFSIVKLVLTLLVYLSWIGTANWVNRDMNESHMDPERWNLAVLGSGLLGLLLLWTIPIFFIGFLAFLLCFGAGALTYVYLRNQLVPAEKRVLTPRHLMQLARQHLKIKGKRQEEKMGDQRPGVPVRFMGRGPEAHEEDRTLVERAEGSKGYRSALQLVYDAVKRRATDIHLEPTREEMSVRFRIDGVMQVTDPFTRPTGDAVVNIFKVLCNLDITEKRKPQDGSFSAQVEDRHVDCRVTTAGSVSGEKLVMRLFDKSAQLISLTQIGMNDRLHQAVRSVVRLPRGLVLVCGPTGAGKSTTLYACLNELDRVQQNIITIENPVEFQLKGVTQIEVNVKAGKTFASELRSILRQDPDVIMIGEVRDQETAEIAFQAAQTGHMVFTTVHSNDTVTAVGRMIDLGVQPFMLASALTAVIGQRLVRLLCPRCKQRYKPNADVIQRLNLPADKVKFFYRPPGPEDGTDKERCDHCNGAGYLGRTGIFELLLMNDNLRRLIRENPDLNAIKQQAAKGGLWSLYEDGLRQVIDGRTSIQELLRVAK